MDLADLAWIAGRLAASEPTPRCQLLRLLAARAYRFAAWQRFASAMRFDAPEWRGLSLLHLDKAIELECLARHIEIGIHPWSRGREFR